MAKTQDIFDEAEVHTRSKQTKCSIPAWFVDKMIAKYNAIGKFKLSVEQVNKIVGYNHDKHRAPAIRKQMRKFYSNLLPDNTEFYVGTTDKDTAYVFGVDPKEN